MASSRTRSKNPTPLFCSLPLRGPLFGASKRVRRRRRRMEEKVADPDAVHVSLSSDEDEEEEEDQVFSVSSGTEETYEDVTGIRGSRFGAETEEEKQRSRMGLKGKRVAEMKGSGFGGVTEEKQRRRSDLKGKMVAEMKGSGFGDVTEEKQRRRMGLKGKRVAESDVVFMGECVDKGEVGSGFGSKRKRESVVCIEISDVDDDDDDDDDSEMGKQGPVHVAVNVKEEQMSEDDKGANFGNGRCGEEHVVVVSSSENEDSGGEGTEDDVVEHSKKKRFQGVVDGGERDDKSEGDKMCSEFDDDEGQNFGNDDCGWVPYQPIVINLDGSENEDESSEAQSGSADGDDEFRSSSESEDDNLGDEDYRVEEVTASDCESSSSYECSDESPKQRGRYRSSRWPRPSSNVLSQKRTRDSTKIDDSERVENSEGNSPIADDNDCVVIETLGTQGVGDSTGVENCERNSPISDANDSVIGNLGTQGGGDSTNVDNGERFDNSERNSPIHDANDHVIGHLGTQGGGEDHHGVKPPLKQSSTETKPFENSESEEELVYLWAEMDSGLRSDDEGSVVRIASSLRRKQQKMGGKSAKLADANDLVNVNHGKGSTVRNISSLPRKQDKMGGESAELAYADDDSVNGTQGGEQHHGKGSVATNVSSLPRKQEKMGESSERKIGENRRWVRRDRINSSNHEKKAWVDKSIGHEDGHHKVLKRKEQRLLDLLSECLLGKQKETKGDIDGFEEKDDDIHPVDTRQAAFGEKPPLKWNFKEDEPLKKSKSQEELDKLWKEMNLELRSEEINSQVGNIGENEARENQTFICKHDFLLNEEIGEICRLCSLVATEIRYVFPPVVDEIPKGSRKRVLSGVDTVLRSYVAPFNVSDGDKDTVSPQNEGTVWDLIPDIKQSLYPHQQEGFEFIWTNLAGTMDRHSLKTPGPCSEGGCIISHAPGTGKTRLTIVFLQTYLEVFPKCRPVIIAPSSILLTWEDEFKKWDIGVPFHNLNTLELSGREQSDAVKEVSNGSPQNSKDVVRMAKLYSWFKEKSVLGISYQLFEKLTGGRNSKKKNRNMRKEKKHASMKENPEAEISVMGKVLLEIPGLLVLDEGHTPRNQHSSIWKVLSSIQTQKKIILSGTPFQNNFVELYNTICLVKPSFPSMIPPELKKFCQSRLMQERKAAEDWTWEPVSSGSNATGNPSDEKIKQLKQSMDPFVHVHKGSILQENLPGLRDCVLILKPDSLQKQILESIDSSKITLNFEYKLALASVHPSLFLCCKLTEKEESVVDRDRLEKLRLSPQEGAKTRFLVEFVRLCDSVHEKVLVFSQYIDPLKLIMDQLKSFFDWDEGKEVLYMSGKLDKKIKQHLIHGFNNDSSKAKVLLASTKACSEGISLVGASRVVLLDVVWNPAVERQAISRAYRLGQKKVVYTYHLLTQETAESAKYCKQAEKDRLSELVFSDPNAEKDSQKSGAVNIEDEVLDKMIHHDKLKDLFGDCVVQPKEKDLIESFGFE